MPHPQIEQKFKEAAYLYKNSLSKEEVLSAFRTMVELIKQLKASNAENNQRLDSQYKETFQRLLGDIKGSDLYKELLDALKSDAKMSVDKLSGDVSSHLFKQIDGLSQREKDMLKNLDVKLGSMKKELTPNMVKIIEEASKGTNNALSPVLKGMIKKEFEKLVKAEKEIIKSFKKELDRMKQTLQSNLAQLHGGTATQAMTMRTYDLSDSLDGATKTFNIPTNWRVIGVYASSFPNALRPTTDYTFTVSTITFTDEIPLASLAAGQTVVIEYLATS